MCPEICLRSLIRSRKNQKNSSSKPAFADERKLILVVMITSSYSDTAGQAPEQIAIQTETEQINYQTWNRLVNQTANWLGSLIDKPENIAILLPNGIPFYNFSQARRMPAARRFR